MRNQPGNNPEINDRKRPLPGSWTAFCSSSLSSGVKSGNIGWSTECQECERMLRRVVHHRGFTGETPSVYPIFPFFHTWEAEQLCAERPTNNDILEAQRRTEASHPGSFSFLSPEPRHCASLSLGARGTDQHRAWWDGGIPRVVYPAYTPWDVYPAYTPPCVYPSCTPPCVYPPCTTPYVHHMISTLCTPHEQHPVYSTPCTALRVPHPVYRTQ